MEATRGAWLGSVAYQQAMAKLELARQEVCAGGQPRLFLLSHPAVITLGRHAKTEHVLSTAESLRSAGIDVVRATRGGEVTLHDSGQLMVYPVLHVGRGVRRFLADVAGALAQVATDLGVAGATWLEDPAGLWWNGRKLAACGIAVSRGVTTHGFALNVATPEAAWGHIVPCGNAGSRPISLEQALGRKLAVADVAARVEPLLREVLGLSAHNVAAAR